MIMRAFEADRDDLLIWLYSPEEVPLGQRRAEAILPSFVCLIKALLCLIDRYAPTVHLIDRIMG